VYEKNWVKVVLPVKEKKNVNNIISDALQFPTKGSSTLRWTKENKRTEKYRVTDGYSKNVYNSEEY
jgi:hypothetical protein